MFGIDLLLAFLLLIASEPAEAAPEKIAEPIVEELPENGRYDWDWDDQ